MSAIVIAPDPGPLARLEDVKGDEHAPSVIFQRLADGESLADIAKAWGVPKGRFIEWFTTQHAALYDAALRVLAGEYAHETVGIADDADEDRDAVAKAKLRTEIRLRLAGHWDRARYGAAKDAGSAGITVRVDRSCGGAVEITDGRNTVRVGGVSTEKTISGPEASALPETLTQGGAA